MRAALRTTIALAAFEQENPPTLSYDELFARYWFCMRLRNVLSKTVSWRTYGESIRSSHGIGSNGSCGFCQVSGEVREKVFAFVSAVGWSRRSDSRTLFEDAFVSMHCVPKSLQICRQPYAVWLRLGLVCEKSRILKG